MGEPELVRTRRSLHAVAEQVLAAALHRATGRIGLRATVGGFGTPVFDGPDGRTQVRIEGTDIVVERGEHIARAALTTVGAAARLVGVEPGAPAGVYPPATPAAPMAPLEVDPGPAALLAEFFAGVDAALRAVVDPRPGIGAEPQLWPEHFDLAVTISEVNLGGSPGDDDHPLPYLYVGPWTVPTDGDPFWNEPFGASLTVDHPLEPAAAAAFFEDGLCRLPTAGG